ncbi:pentatricopeptide repeat-containing protein At4g14170-like [Andrographis paniculata]|uniref:pentatricopeptide repeat-containing protein At4g14170-like n=1 Tax=Andrographis paniculata TaxID=175694 RepID=UPI0021E94F76|nr:pentatricopeptide repeat-containing protein At4g14170-like [Andrographis paniculata]
MSNVVRSCSARQLFDKGTKRYLAPHAAWKGRTQPKKLSMVDPYELFAQDDVLKSWTSKISSLVRENRPREAIGLFKAMLVSEQRPNFVTVLSVIKAVGLIGGKDMARGIHGYSLKMGFIDSEVAIVTALVSVYSCWDMTAAIRLYNHTPCKDLVLCSAMISACANNGEFWKAIKLLKAMVIYGMQPNHVTISSALSASADLASLNLGREIHGYSIRRSFYSYVILHNSLLDMYSKCRHIEAALLLFGHMQEKDIVSWRIMIHGCVENGSPRKALDIFLELQSCCVDKADELIIQEVIRAYSQLSENCIQQGFHSYVLKMGFTEFASAVTELLQTYAEFDDIESARRVFDELRLKDLIAWSAMIAVYAESSQPDTAFGLLRQMQMANKNPNEFTLVSLLQACFKVDALEIGKNIHAHVIKSGYSTNAFLTSALIDMYCKFGRTREGKTVFEENPSDDFICWSSMINGYGINGYGEEVLECFSNMLHRGIKPNDVVFISVLSACSHCGLEYEGWSWFHSMETVYQVKRNLAHYACMVDMLSRQGNIEEGLEFVNSMPIEPDRRIWGALLAGCRNIDGPAEILEFVAKKLISLDPENASYYVLLSNLYAEQGRWEEVEKLRRRMDTRLLKKVTGSSAI